MNLIYKSVFTLITVLAFINFVLAVILIIVGFSLRYCFIRLLEIFAPMSFESVYKMVIIQDTVKKATIAIISRLGLYHD